MAMIKSIGYDVGGGEGPFSSQLEIIDALPFEDVTKMWGHSVMYLRYHQRNLSLPGWNKGLTPRSLVHCSRTLRCIKGIVGPHPHYGIVDGLMFEEVIAELCQLVAPGGTLLLYDFDHLIRRAARHPDFTNSSTEWMVHGVVQMSRESRFAATRNPISI